MLPIIDIQISLEQAAGNEVLAKDLLSMLLKELPILNDKVQQAISQGNHTAMWDHAHKLYGSTAYCGVPALRASAKRLEEAIKMADFEQISLVYVEVNEQIIRLTESGPGYLIQTWS